MIPIQQIKLPTTGLEELHAEAKRDGYDFIDTLVDEWASGVNRFEAPGEVLCGHLDHGQLVAVGGLTIDPFTSEPGTGRIRRVYVRSAWRNQGVGRALVSTLVQEARKSFRCVRLRAENAGAARLYERMGFTPIDDPGATHALFFEDHEDRA
ncbi:GNAT family N-acetyltransferase [Tunturiibacter gelidoferens]|uniref:GNAT superfamily N-acetyltransferase n=2 Tax=Tunturiibacter TaxID=3154218 RepID=A0A7Y9NL99_9BACT|nr:GNAT family N-acetyltransferase [Edaphobacter lichenicola]MBB5339433.1 GNAT superfamily N-acetyltransferase [Edaphobacter lichenicola]NYF51307.1 GNAT superfamily N-acetyltransferase [Edaphobacter lichenicola]